MPFFVFSACAAEESVCDRSSLSDELEKHLSKSAHNSGIDGSGTVRGRPALISRI